MLQEQKVNPPKFKLPASLRSNPKYEPRFSFEENFEDRIRRLRYEAEEKAKDPAHNPYLLLPETQLLDKTRFPMGFFDKENLGDNLY